jgi:DNA-binding response OmpR family regulator
LQKLSILLIEDNLTIATQLTEFFEGQGWVVDYASNGEQGVELALSQPFDVVVLDLNLPDIDGLTVCCRIKQQAKINLPVLMLTARDAFEDKAQGYGEGADDYVTKPFDFREVALRCQALAKRHQLHQSQTIEIGDLKIEQKQHLAFREDQPLKLTNIGFKLLLALAEMYPQAVTRSNLIHKVWQDNPPDTDALRSHIYSLRNSLDKPFSYPMLTTITNVGFKLEVKDRNSDDVISNRAKPK